MKKFFTLIAVAAMAFAAQANILTVAEGTGEAQYAPFYGFQMDALGSISQVIYPADMLADMNGGTITEIKFYPTQAFGALGSGNLQISLKEVEQDRYTSTTLVTDATVVGNAYPVQGNAEWVIVFDQPFEYHGGNLMIETELIQVGSYKDTKFFGQSFSYAVGIAQYKYSWGADYYYEVEQVLPKATFTYDSEPIEITSYTVVGPESIFGSNWNTEDTNNDMVLDEATGVYSWNKTGVTLYGNFDFKVVGNHSYSIYEWPVGPYNWTAVVEEEGIYNIAITFDPNAEEDYRITCTLIKTGDIDPVEHTYTVAGTTNLFGSFWDPSDTANDMVEGEDGIYAWTKSDVVFEEAANVEFKVVQDHAWDYAWPSSNWVYEVTEAGTYDFVITFNAETKEITCTATKHDAPQGMRGDVNMSNDVTISDVTSLIDYLLSGDETGISVVNANCNLDEGVTIADVTALIDYLLSGVWAE